ncbi:MAG: amidohydrolase family protein [Candidatus Bathyarchaeota archaeon]|nr:amidohydrolase family protein [Candidatus Bathyarchaeota archaeon]
MEIIDFEAHFYTKKYVETLLRNPRPPRYIRGRGGYSLQYVVNTREPHPYRLVNRLLELGGGRLSDMDDAGVTMQVLSLSAPGCEQFEASVGVKLAREVNDELSAVVEKSGGRLVGLAALAPQDPEEAADELERAVRDLGLRGWKTHSNIMGTYLDDEKYWVILDKAERLRVPIFLHPTVPRIKALSKSYGYILSGPAFGFAFETALCAMRLILSGVFDKYPGLKLVLGHLGETMPFMLNRIDFPFIQPWVSPNLKIKLSKRPSEYFRNNFLICTSGEFQDYALTCALQAMGDSRVLFASDYPYEETKAAVERVKRLPIEEESKKRIFSLNAKRLLNLP